jgi:hypothetical protein
MFTGVQLPVRQGWGWGRGEARIPPAAPTPLTLPYLYCTSVQFTNFVRELLVNIASGEYSRDCTAWPVCRLPPTVLEEPEVNVLYDLCRLHTY